MILLLFVPAVEDSVTCCICAVYQTMFSLPGLNLEEFCSGSTGPFCRWATLITFIRPKIQLRKQADRSLYLRQDLYCPTLSIHSYRTNGYLINCSYAHTGSGFSCFGKCDVCHFSRERVGPTALWHFPRRPS